MQGGLGTHEVEKVYDLCGRQAQRVPVLVQRLLILEDKGDR